MTSKPEQRDLSELFPPAADQDVTEELIGLHLIETMEGVRASAALRDSLEKRGQLQPVILNATGEHDKYQIVDGRRRIAALRELGKHHVRAYVYKVNPIVEASLAITANAVRGANPVSDALAIIDLAGAGYSERDIARATGLAVGTIRKRMKLAALHDDIFRGMRAGTVAIGVAERVASLPAKRQEALAELLDKKGKITGEDVDAANREGVGAALASLDPDLFGAPEPETAEEPVELTPQDRLRAALRDVAMSQYGIVDGKAWRAACAAVWKEIESAG